MAQWAFELIDAFLDGWMNGQKNLHLQTFFDYHRKYSMLKSLNFIVLLKLMQAQHMMYEKER